jgi:hypothetical protein
MTYFEVCSWVSVVVALHACVKYRRITDIIQKSKIASRYVQYKFFMATNFKGRGTPIFYFYLLSYVYGTYVVV